MTPIFNETFEVGQVFRGMVDGATLFVRAIGAYRIHSEYSGNHIDNSPEYIWFQNQETGYVSKVSVGWAKHLLLERRPDLHVDVSVLPLPRNYHNTIAALSR